MSSVSKEKGRPQYIIEYPDISYVGEEKEIWIYCRVCMKYVNMRYAIKGLRYNENVLSVSHKDTKEKQEHPKTGYTSHIKQSYMMSFISVTQLLVDGGSSSSRYVTRNRQIDKLSPVFVSTSNICVKRIQVPK